VDRHAADENALIVASELQTGDGTSRSDATAKVQLMTTRCIYRDQAVDRGMWMSDNRPNSMRDATSTDKVPRVNCASARNVNAF
jgi:hypothetical protein